MDFEKKLKLRLNTGIAYCVIGVILIVADIFMDFENYFISTFSITLLLLGILRIVQNKRITKSEKAMHKCEVAETDERNKMIAERAKSWSFSCSILLAGIIVIVLSFLGYHDQAQPFGWFVCVMITLYWVFWFVARRKY